MFLYVSVKWSRMLGVLQYSFLVYEHYSEFRSPMYFVKIVFFICICHGRQHSLLWSSMWPVVLHIHIWNNNACDHAMMLVLKYHQFCSGIWIETMITMFQLIYNSIYTLKVPPRALTRCWKVLIAFLLLISGRLFCFLLRWSKIVQLHTQIGDLRWIPQKTTV